MVGSEILEGSVGGLSCRWLGRWSGGYVGGSVGWFVDTCKGGFVGE